MNTKDTLEVAPAKIAEGQWAVKSAHLIGSDQVCPDELSAKRMAKFAEACIEAARAKDAELIQILVDALEQSHRDGRGAYSITMLDALDAAAAQGLKPSDQ